MLDNQREHHLSFPLDMTEIKAWECDSCGGKDSTEHGEYIKQCGICGDDFCDSCQEEHAKDECGF
jgi:hypothetical protein